MPAEALWRAGPVPLLVSTVQLALLYCGKNMGELSRRASVRAGELARPLTGCALGELAGVGMEG